jgi:probable phosphoglycerate mutase
MTVLGLVRHGITDWNIERRAQGHTDIPLNAEGRKQAERLARRLSSENWDIIYSSDLGRARDTAQAIASIKNIPVLTDPLLREINLGQIEGMTEEEIVAKWGPKWRELDLDMESREALGLRGVSALTRISEQHPDLRILIVSHGGFIGTTLKCMIPHVETLELLHNTSLTILKKQSEGWDCELYNCTNHLLEE